MTIGDVRFNLYQANAVASGVHRATQNVQPTQPIEAIQPTHVTEKNVAQISPKAIQVQKSFEESAALSAEGRGQLIDIYV